eukprot:2936753-Amphidinium_carterae.1
MPVHVEIHTRLASRSSAAALKFPTQLFVRSRTLDLYQPYLPGFCQLGANCLQSMLRPLSSHSSKVDQPISHESAQRIQFSQRTAI